MSIEIHPSTVVSSEVEIGEDVKIGPQCSLEGCITIGAGTWIAGHNYLRGPLVIGENCIIKDSYIGPFTSIGNNAQITDGEIEHSIIFNDASINCSQRIVDSILGEGSIITSCHQTLPSGHQLFVGDNSMVEL